MKPGKTARVLSATALTFILFALLSQAQAATYYSDTGQSRTWNLSVVPGTHKFIVNGIISYRETDWYVNGGFVRTDISDLWNGYWDPTYECSFSAGQTVKIEANVYNSNSQWLETHTWNIAVPAVTGLSFRNSSGDVISQIEAGQTVYLRADAVGMNGQTVSVELWEDDGIGDDLILTAQIAISASGFGTYEWRALWQDTDGFLPENSYYLYYSAGSVYSGSPDTGHFSVVPRSGNPGPGPDRGNTAAQEYGDALYDKFDLIATLGYDYNHAGLFAGFDNAGTARTFESSFSDEPADPNNDPSQGPQEGRFLDNFQSGGADYYGAYIPSTYTSTMAFSDRKAVVGKAREVVDAYIYYPILTLNALNPKSAWTAPIDADEIYSIRCDGLVEYSYERSGLRVWGNCTKPDDQWNIAYYPDNHNNNPGFTVDPHFELSPWAQRGAPPATGPSGPYQGPPWPDTKMTKPSVVNLPTIQFITLSLTSTYADIEIRATDESSIFMISGEARVIGVWNGIIEGKNPERHPVQDSYAVRVMLSGQPGLSLELRAKAQDHGGNWCGYYYTTITFPSGTVQVNTVPEAGTWTLTGPDGFSQPGSGSQTVPNVPTGSCTVTWNALDGYDTPSPRTQVLGNGATITFSGTYVRQMGTAQVNTVPATGTWTLTGPDGYSHAGSGSQTVANVPTGSCTVTWNALDGYDTPPPQTQVMGNGATITFSGTYVRQTGTVQVNTVPEAGTWTLTGPDGYSHPGSGNETIHGVPTGVYTLTWHFLLSYRVPSNSPETEQVVKSATTTFTGIYTYDPTGPVASNVAGDPTKVREKLDVKVTVHATIDDTNKGNSNIEAAECSVGVGPGTAMTPDDRAFDSPVEAVTGIINSGNWRVGDSYRVNVKGKDCAGNWGAVDSILYAPGQQYEVVDGTPPGKILDLKAEAVSSLAGIPASLADSSGQHATYDAGEIVKVGAVGLAPVGPLSFFPKDFAIAVSQDNASWDTVTPVAEARAFKAAVGSYVWQFEPVNARYVRISGPGIHGSASVVIYKSLGTAGARLTWTAPADDGYDPASGKAAEYDVRCNGDQVHGIGEPKLPGQKEDYTVGVDATGAAKFTVKTADEVLNWSPVSEETPATLYATGLIPEEPESGISADALTPPTFRFKIEGAPSTSMKTAAICFSSCPGFPPVATPRPDGQIDKCLKFALRTTATSWTPTASQWKAIKALACTEGAIYWRLEGKHTAYGTVFGPARHFFFDCGDISGLDVEPSHDKTVEMSVYEAIWPDKNAPPTFSWMYDGSGVAPGASIKYFWIDISTGENCPLGDSTQTMTLGGAGMTTSLYTLKAAEWKKVRQLAAKTVTSGTSDGTLYWRVRGKDAGKVLECASAVKTLIVDGGAWDVWMDPLWTINWTHDGEGITTYYLEFSVWSDFKKGTGTARFPTRGIAAGPMPMECMLSEKQLGFLANMADKFHVGALYYRVCGMDTEKAFVTHSAPPETTSAP